jgi:hypothetical protein
MDSMKTFAGWTVAAALAVLSTPAFAQGLTGKAPPETPIVESWNGAGEKSLEDFEGKVILLEIFATW